MYIVPESAIAGLLTREACFSAVEAVFVSMAEGRARNFPVIREQLGHADAIYGFKSGFDRQSGALGLKSGGFWPGNAARGLTNHQSTIVLFEADTGQVKAVVGANLITALRTAAASAVSIRHLAREDAQVLGILGAGHQATFQLRAALEQRPFRKVIGWNRDASKLTRLAAVAEEFGLPFEPVSPERLAAEADVIVTILSATAPILPRAGVRPGTHIACMGTDTRGKQEVSTELVAAGKLFTDEIAQSESIGEFQHAVGAGLIVPADITPLGCVISGAHPGRDNAEDITIYDGTGVALQDLAVADAVLSAAVASGQALSV
ncbi:iminosuccinate reductase BhcD [Pararhodobacter sp. CCB-MM2]|uniref:iminosuccinate reductase BhcD n=1 Tax=Pararhodobacter sp. CCB-MM2 TaxID=1786003 RepID=UPI00082F072B|nr:iminosuccinate reductase BhcD [Pararhodobacter sp. CCB-MM2]